jgi:RNA polymerase sigma factor (sigma-70 family)
MSDTKSTQASNCFPTTQWTLIIEVIQKGDEDAAWKALEDFCEHYRPAIFNFFKRRGRNHADAEEFTQEFFLTRIHRHWDIRKGFLFRAERDERSKFRCFLGAILRRFLIDKWRETQRRPPEAQTNPESQDPLELAVDPNPNRFGRQFDREVALEIFQKAAGQSTRSKYLLAHFRGDLSQADAARELGVSEEAFKQAYHRFRQNFPRDLRKEVSKLVGTGDGEIDAEIKYLMSLFANAGA